LRRITRSLAGLVIVFALFACGDGAGPDPVDPNSIEGQINALFPQGADLRDVASTRIANIRQALTQSNAATAKSEAMSLVSFTLTALKDGKLVGGKSDATRASASRLINDVYAVVSLTPPNIPAGALTDDGAAQIVGPAGGLVVTPSGVAGVQFPQGALPAEVLVTIVRIPASTPGAGPLPTPLKQYPPYYEYSTTPEVLQFGDSARVGLCQVSDPSNPFYPPEPHDRLRLAHAVGNQIEILDRVAVNDFLRCTSVSPNTGPGVRFGWQGALQSIAREALDLFRPTELYAAHGGLGGKTKKFSPFAAVDPTSGPVATVTVAPPTLQLVAGTTGQLNATTRDASNTIVTGRVVTWSSSDINVATVNTTTGLVTAVAPGNATITATSEGKTGTAGVSVTPAAAPGILRGRVFNAATGANVSGATIVIRNSAGATVATLTSAANGDYQTASLPPGTYTAAISAPSFIATDIASIKIDGDVFVESVPLAPSTAQTGTIAGSVLNATTNTSITATVTLALRAGVNATSGTPLQTTTATTGAYSFTGVAPGTYTIAASSNGFVDAQKTVVSLGGAASGNQSLFMSPVGSAGNIRIVLTWGLTPSDLDAHLSGPLTGGQRFIVDYTQTGNCAQSPNATLDVDVVNGTGPETITICTQRTGVYRYIVNNFSANSDGVNAVSTTLANSSAHVDLYINNAFVRTFNVPGGAGSVWTVFDLNGSTITPINTITAGPWTSNLPSGSIVGIKSSEAKSKAKHQ
jgi:uncharacterized protein YfaP (DUF2135 family)